MNNIKECCLKYHINISKVEYFSYYTILYDDSKMYLWKKKDSSKKELFDYLESIQYPYYLPQLNDYEDYFELYYYYPDKTNDIPMKGKEIVQALILLHLNSMYYEELITDDLENMYEKIKGQIDSLMHYYLDLQNYIEQFSFPRIDYYTFIRNSSLFYQTLSMAKKYLEDWYSGKPSRVRKSYIIDNNGLSNFRLNQKSYFIDFKDCRQDIMVYDFVSFYKKEVLQLDMNSLFSYYQSKVFLDDSECNLFFALILIPEKIDFKNDIYSNTVKIHNTVDSIMKTIQFVSEENEKNQKTNEQEFKE